MVPLHEEDQRPLVIVGTGRCGSTLLHRLLGLHEELGWLSQFNELAPRIHAVSVASRLYSLRAPERMRESRGFPKPFETYRFWESYVPGFSRRDRPQTASDVRPEAIDPLLDATARVLRYQGRDRLLVKVTGWSRIMLFDAIYPNASFVSLRRDPRSVVSSWIQAGWLDVTTPPDSPEWQWGEVPPAYLSAWKELGADQILSTALKIRLDLDDIRANARQLPRDVLELAYEDLIESPSTTLQELCDFAGLRWTAGFEAAVGDRTFRDSTNTWRRHLSAEDGDRIVEFMNRTETD